MDPNYAQIAAAVTAALAPFTPYLVEGGMKFAGQAGEAAWQKAQELWGKVQARFGDDPKVKGASLLVSADPGDQASQATLAKTLGEKLKDDPTLAEELARILGGNQAIQKIIAEGGSWIEDVTQEMTGAGTQTTEARDQSTIKGAKQSIKKFP